MLMNSNYTGPVNVGNPIEHTIEGKKNTVLLDCDSTKPIMCSKQGHFDWKEPV